MVSNLNFSYDAGIAKGVKDCANSMEINDVKHTVLAGDPVSNKVLRIKNRLNHVAGVSRPKIDRAQSIAFGN